MAWLAVFFVIPSLIVFAIALRPADPSGGVGAGWTLDTIRSLGNAGYPAIAWRTLWISAATTALCLLLAVPVGYGIARADRRLRNALLLLVIVPFWTSSLVRIFAWKVLLHPDGWTKQALALCGLAGRDALLLYNAGAVVLVQVYTFLPFAILPIYAAAEKFDRSLIDAARDLGATKWQAFREVFVPGIRRGLAAAALLVFIPALGSYVVPDLVGGPDNELIGNKIAQRVFVDRNLPHAGALSAALMLAVLAPLLAALVLQARRAAGPAKEAP
jgi:spermidine/putrescine transport system permease protein